MSLELEGWCLERGLASKTLWYVLKFFDLKYVIVSLQQEFRLGFKFWKLANGKFPSLLACKPDHIPIPVLKKSLYSIESTPSSTPNQSSPEQFYHAKSQLHHKSSGIWTFSTPFPVFISFNYEIQFNSSSILFKATGKLSVNMCKDVWIDNYIKLRSITFFCCLKFTKKFYIEENVTNQ